MIPRVHPAALNCFVDRSRVFLRTSVCRRRLEILRSVSPLFRPTLSLSLFPLIVRGGYLSFFIKLVVAPDIGRVLVFNDR